MSKIENHRRQALDRLLQQFHTDDPIQLPIIVDEESVDPISLSLAMESPEAQEISGVQYPSSPSQWATWAGHGSPCGHYWRHSQASGNSIDTGDTGGVDLSPANSPTLNVDDADLGKCVEFAKSTNQRLIAASASSLDLGTSESFAAGGICRLMDTPFGTNASMFGKRKTTSGFDGYIFSFNFSTTPRAQWILDGDGLDIELIGNVTNPANNDIFGWCMIADYNADNLVGAFYANGTLVATPGQAIATTITTNAFKFAVGAIEQTNNATPARYGDTWFIRGAAAEGFTTAKFQSLMESMNVDSL